MRACEEEGDPSQIVRPSPTGHRSTRQYGAGASRIILKRLGEWRCDPSWRDGIHPHAVGGISDGQRLGKLSDASLGAE